MTMQRNQKTKADVETGIGIISSIYVEARMTSDLGELRRLIANLPNVTAVSTGTRVRCEIKGEPRAFLECDANGIAYSYEIDNDSVHAANSNLVTLLSLLAYLGSVYEVRLPSLYRYLINAINVSGIGSASVPSKHGAESRFAELADSNLTLAASIRGYVRENKTLKSKTEAYRALMLALLQKLSKHPISKNAMAELAGELNMDQRLFENAVELLETEGIPGGGNSKGSGNGNNVDANENR